MKVTGTQGSMWFRSHMAAWEFTTKIEQWSGFATKQHLTREEAVDYHLIYCKGGARAVLEHEQTLLTQKHEAAMAEAHRATLIQREKEQRYAAALSAGRCSEEYRVHYDSWHPSFKWGA